MVTDMQQTSCKMHLIFYDTQIPTTKPLLAFTLPSLHLFLPLNSALDQSCVSCKGIACLRCVVRQCRFLQIYEKPSRSCFSCHRTQRIHFQHTSAKHFRIAPVVICQYSEVSELNCSITRVVLLLWLSA